MKVENTNTTAPTEFEFTIKVNAKELDEILIVLANAPNRTRWYHRAGDALYKALNEATGNKRNPLAAPFQPQDRSYSYGYRKSYGDW